jgi:hypothetical protein
MLAGYDASCCIAEPLLDLECSSVIASEQPVNTVTFFKGCSGKSAHESMVDRVREVLKVNPWVAGRIIRSKTHKNLQLIHPKGDVDISDEILGELLRLDPADLTLNSKMPYDDMVNAIVASSVTVPVLAMPTFSSDFESKELVTRITIVSDSVDPLAVALILSMSHIVADGSTYYQFMHMLSKSAKITPLRATRNQAAFDKIPASLGETDYNFMLGSGLIGNAIGGLVFGKKAQLFCHYIDDARMAAAKAAAKEQCTEHGVKFVSSNDVLVSELAKLTGVRLWMMAMNFRGRVDGIDMDLAGNYESCLWLDKGVYSSPATIRKILRDGPPFKAHSEPLPSTWECITSAQLGNCSSWAFSKEELAIGEATQQLHIPLIPTGAIPFESVCMFYPSKGKLAVMILSKRFERDAFLEALPLGADVFA